MSKTSFRGLLIELINASELTQKEWAKALGISPQYFYDLKEGRRLPSVRIVKAICQYTARGPQGCLVWHRAAAQAHGWEI